MSEIFNYSYEMVSVAELEMLANYYRQEIEKVNLDMQKYLFYQPEHEELRRKKFVLMRRKWYLLLCARKRIAQN